MVYSDLSYAYKRLRDTLGENRVSTDPTEKIVYGHDFASLPKQAGIQFQLKPDIIVLPKSPQEVVRVLQLGSELKIPVVPRGGGTSLHGGSVPNVGGILLCTNLMNRVEEVDKERMCVTAEAGATWEAVMEAVAQAGMSLPVVPIFSRSSTIGGFLSNGGVGIGSFGHGALSQWVRSLEVALPDGQIIETGERGFDLGSFNYNLTHLFLGAEGTLGAITKATLRLVPAPSAVATSAFSFDSVGAMGEGLLQLSRSPVRPYHVGFMDGSHLLLQRALLKEVPEVPALVVIAFAGVKEMVEAEKAAAESVLSGSGGTKQDGAGSVLWEDRHEPYNARRISGGLVTAEGLLPSRRLGEAMEMTVRAAKKVRSEPAFHGFLVDGSSAYLAPYILTNERFLRGQLAISFVERYHRILTELEGHPLGLGLLASYNLEAMHGHVAAYMKGVKEAVDPEAVLNRGKLLGSMGRKPPLVPPEIPPGLMRRGLRALGALRKLMPSDKYIRRLRRR